MIQDATASVDRSICKIARSVVIGTACGASVKGSRQHAREKCAALMGRLIVNVPVKQVQCDEI
jgi:hypothetical protein